MNKKTKTTLIVLFVVGLLIVFSIGVILNEKNSYYDVNKFKIKKEQVDDISEAFGNAPVKICDIEKDECVTFAKLP